MKGSYPGSTTSPTSVSSHGAKSSLDPKIVHPHLRLLNLHFGEIHSFMMFDCSIHCFCHIQFTIFVIKAAFQLAHFTMFLLFMVFPGSKEAWPVSVGQRLADLLLTKHHLCSR